MTKATPLAPPAPAVEPAAKTVTLALGTDPRQVIEVPEDQAQPFLDIGWTVRSK